MKVALLQPCFFPYEGYYKIVEEVDHVIFLDDNVFTSKEWLNKTILDVSGKPYFFRIGVSNKCGKITRTNQVKCGHKWRKKFLKAIRSGYRNAPNFDVVYPLLEEIVNLPTDQLSNVAAYSVYRVHEFLHVQRGNRAPSRTKFSLSSVKHYSINTFLPEKLLEISKKEKAKEIICLPYMKNLFDFKEYKKNRIKASFLGSGYNKYSIINKLMYDKDV